MFGADGTIAPAAPALPLGEFIGLVYGELRKDKKFDWPEAAKIARRLRVLQNPAGVPTPIMGNAQKQAGVSETDAGQDSRHLDEREQTQAAEHAAPQAIVIHEVIREEGELELRRRNAALLWSGLAAGLSMGFSLLTLAFLQSGLPDEPWRRLLDSSGYCVGFVITILGRQQLFTESTLTAVLPLMVRRDLATLLSLLRMWGIVLAANLIGTFVFAALISPEHLFSGPVRHALIETGQDILSGPTGFKILKAMFAGWLIATMVWLLPSARSARLLVIVMLTYVVAVARLPHVIAGSVEAAFAVVSGHADIADYVFHFLLPTLLGNTIGGVALVAFLNHAPLAPELQEDAEAHSEQEAKPLNSRQSGKAKSRRGRK